MRLATKTVSANRHGPDVGNRKGELRVIDTIKFGIEDDLRAFIRVSNSPTIEWHVESGDPENGATVYFDRETALELRDFLNKVLEATK